MTARQFALIVGIFYLAVGLMGFVPGLVYHAPTGAPDGALPGDDGYLLGVFPVNTLHNVVHLVVGALGIAAYNGTIPARGYGKGLFAFFGTLALLGMIPRAATLFGLVPLHGHDIWLHGFTSLLGAFFGFAPREVVADGRARYAPRSAA